MSVFLSPVGGVAAQFFDNSGNVLTGGKLYTYAAGTTTPAATYTSSLGNVAHPNPIVLDGAGRVPNGGEIWLTDGVVYKFVLKTSTDVTIATYDNITGINSNFVNYTTEQEIQTATAGQTVFELADVTYAPGTNSLTVYVDGVNQYGPGAEYSYEETDSTTVTFNDGLHVGASVKFTTATQTTGNATDASVVAFTGFKGQTGNVQNLADDDGSDWIGFLQAGTGAVAESVQDKLRQTVSVKDFGAVGDGVTDDTAAIRAAMDSGVLSVYFPSGTYAITSLIFDVRGQTYSGTVDFVGIAGSATDAVVEIVERNLSFERLAVNQNFNTNYTSAVKWHSLSSAAPAQYIKIKQLLLNNCIIGILFGQLDGTVVVDAPQSENSITHFNTRGCQIPLYVNQSNGWLMISDSTINSLRNEWEIYNPGVYDYAQSRVVRIYQGVVMISNSELLKTDTQLGYGIEMIGGSLFCDNTTWEIASINIHYSSGSYNNGKVYASNSFAYFSNASAQFINLDSAGSLGSLILSNFTAERADGAKNSSQPFIKHLGADSFEFKLSNVTLVNFISGIEFRGYNNAYTVPYCTQISNMKTIDGDVSRVNMVVPDNHRGDNLLYNKGVDVDCDTTNGWYYKLYYGAGSSMSVVADSAASSPKNKILTNAMQLVATGQAAMQTVDETSLATIKATAFPVSQNTLLLISGRLKATVAGSQRKFGAVFYDATGVTRTISTPIGGTSSADIDGTWRYFETKVVVPSGVKYAGLTVDATTSTVLITDVSFKVLN